MLLALTALLTSQAHAAACDSKALTKALTEATPGGAAQAFLDLAACDKTAAKANAQAAFAKILPGPSAEKAVIQALDLGLADSVRSWISLMQPDEKSGYINTLGRTCDKAQIPAFFLDTAKNANKSFWEDRYYAGLDECRTADVSALLESLVATVANDQTRYSAILGVYAANQGGKAIPKLSEWLAAEKNAYNASFILQAFQDAAGVGSEAGLDPEAAKAAIAAITTAAPNIPSASAEEARRALLALGDDADADKMVVQRYRDLVQGGTLTWGLYVVKAGTCKKGDVKVEVHSAMIKDAGHTWPDEMATRVQPAVDKIAWSLPKDCTGTPELTLGTSPVKDQAEFDAWLKDRDTETVKKYPDAKIKTYSDAALPL